MVTMCKAKLSMGTRLCEFNSLFSDTDSVMINFKTRSIEHAMKLAEKALVVVNDLFPSPIKLEFEKIYSPYMLLSKKRYAGLMYTSNPQCPEKIDVRGLETVRRDSCKFVQEIMQACLELILKDRDANKAVQLIRQSVQKLYQGLVSYDKLILTRKLSKVDYKQKVR